MKRYWLFSGGQFYADGGIKDFVCSFDIIKHAIYCAKYYEQYGHINIEWWHIFDTVTEEIIEDNGVKAYGSGPSFEHYQEYLSKDLETLEEMLRQKVNIDDIELALYQAFDDIEEIDSNKDNNFKIDIIRKRDTLEDIVSAILFKRRIKKLK